MSEKGCIIRTHLDIAKYLGMHVQTIKKRGRLPEHDLKTPTGRGAWFPATIDAWNADVKAHARKPGPKPKP